jgi:hypothetical protein
MMLVDLMAALKAMVWAQRLVARLAELSLEEKTASKWSLAQEMEAEWLSMTLVSLLDWGLELE